MDCLEYDLYKDAFYYHNDLFLSLEEFVNIFMLYIEAKLYIENVE